MQSVTGGGAPNPQTVAARRNFGNNCAQRLLEHELRPAFDRAGNGIAAMVEIDRGKAFLLRQNIGNAVAVSGLHSGERSGVICPGIGIRYAGVPLRSCRHKGRLLPAAARLRRPPPDRPLRPLEQRRQRARQLREVGLMRRGLRGNRVAAHVVVPSKGATASVCSPPPSLLLHHFKRDLVVHLVGYREFRIRLELRINEPAPPAVLLPQRHFRPVTPAVLAEPPLQPASAARCESAGPACRCWPSSETPR